MARRGPGWSTALALATSLACLFVLFTSGAAAVTLPAGFEETTVLPGVGKPQDIAIAPNGRVFVAEKTGFIRTYASVDDTTPTLFADLRAQVHNYGSRGLLSIVADPGFPAKPYVYVYYTMDAPLGGTPPVYGGGSFDACPKYDDPQDGDLDKAGVQTIGQVDNCPVGLAHLAAPGRRRGHDRLREGAGPGLLPAVRRPRGRRSRLRQGRQADRLGQRRLHLAVLGLGPVGIAEEPVR